MLTHRNTVIAFIIFSIVLVVCNNYYFISPFIYVLLVLLFLSIEFYGAAYIQSGFHIKAICQVNTKEKVIALTFDDGPSEQTKKILEVLKEFNVTATFFCIGNRIAGKEDILKKTDAAGHTIGNHSYSHDYLYDLKTTSAILTDIQKASEEIKNVIGKSPAFFRPPYGVTTPGLARAVKKINLEVIGWNIRSLDTKIKDKNQLLLRIKQQLKPGSVLLMHDTIPGIELVLKELLIYLQNENYKVTSLESLIQKKAYV